MNILKAGRHPLPDLAEFIRPFARLLARRESVESLERYSTGLLSDIDRKTAAGIGRHLPGTNGVRLQEFLTNTQWESREMDRLRVERMVRDASVGEGVLIIDDTGLPKKGQHSVGVARQYSGTLGRVDNCQVLVTAHYADRLFDWPVTAQVYLPEAWTEDPERRAKAKVPEGVQLQTKPEIGLDLIDWSIDNGVPARVVVVDAGYGQSTVFLDGLEERALPYVAAVKSNTQFRAAAAVDADPGGEDVPAPTGRPGRPRKARGLEDRVPAQDADALMSAAAKSRWTKAEWREGVKGPLVKRVKAVRAYRVGSRGRHIPTCGWLIAERSVGGSHETKYYFAWGLDRLSRARLIELAHIRWIVERFYQDAKGELGLDDYEGRLWTGLHRHVALVMLCHSYLTLRQTYAGAGREADSDSPAHTAIRSSDTPGRGFPP